jgi:hypothetical protein
MPKPAIWHDVGAAGGERVAGPAPARPLADPLRTLRGLQASGVLPDDEIDSQIRGSTTILELLRMYPDGRAAKLMSRLHWPCAHCGGAVREPLTMAAKRHRNDPRAVLDAFRAIEDGGPSDELVARAAERVARS